MATERLGLIKFSGKEQTVVGDDIQVDPDDVADTADDWFFA